MDRNQDKQGLVSQRRRTLLRAIGGATGMASAAIVAGSGLIAAASATGTGTGAGTGAGVDDIGGSTAAADAVTPFQVAIPQAALEDLAQRLARTRWPDVETSGDWRQGVPLATAQSLAAYWRDHYDWRRFERKLNAFAQFRTQIDGLGIHFLHVRSKHAHALPLLLTHGWPGSIVEFLKIIPMLTDPVAHGGKAEDAFHVIIPSLPGFGFSDKPRAAGWNLMRTGKAWAALMARLGYKKWVAQGGDWGAGVTTVLGHLKPPGLAGIHLNWQFVFPEKLPATLSAAEQRAVDGANKFLNEGSGYFRMQATRPQTIGYALDDSPVALMTFIYDKFHDWADPASVLSRDELLDNISLYWLTGTGASSARIYWENANGSFSGGKLSLPVAASVFPYEIYRAPESWARQTYSKLVYWNEVGQGGHFAAFEQPALFVQELRAGFRPMR